MRAAARRASVGGVLQTLIDSTLLLDEIAARADAQTGVTVMVDAPAATTYAAALDIDFATMPADDPLMRWLFAIRGVPDRIARAINGTEAPGVPPAQLRQLGEGPAEWIRLDERPGEELVFGAIGRFWRGEVRWRPTTADEFADFAEPGWAKIACSVSVHPHGEGRSLLTYECRTTGTDAAAARGFKRYWRIVAPGVRLVFWRSAVAIRRRAEATL